jgi:hypothetical protein
MDTIFKSALDLESEVITLHPDLLVLKDIMGLDEVREFSPEAKLRQYVGGYLDPELKQRFIIGEPCSQPDQVLIMISETVSAMLEEGQVLHNDSGELDVFVAMVVPTHNIDKAHSAINEFMLNNPNAMNIPFGFTLFHPN